ncbi:MAG: GNAT family N-acetyltransferase [Gemmatimonadaceae bacterium]
MQPDRECELKIAIRPFEPEDAGAVSALIAVTMRESNARDYPPERLEALIAYFTPEKLRTLARERYCLVALAGGRLIGTAAREGDALATFFVDPEYQGRGVGTHLLVALEREARNAGLRSLRVEASLTGTPFYERRGYQRTGAIVAATAGPHICLGKHLREVNSREHG